MIPLTYLYLVKQIVIFETSCELLSILKHLGQVL